MPALSCFIFSTTHRLARIRSQAPLTAVWIRAYKNAWNLGKSTANCLFTFPRDKGGLRISSIQVGSLEFQTCFRGSRIDSGTWRPARNRAEMEVTWRLPPALRRRQPSVFIILTAQGYSPWHHPRHGSHWLRLQPRGAWAYKEQNVHGFKQDRVFGWRRGLSMLNMDMVHSGGKDFEMRSAIEDHMSEEDLGPEASKQEA